MLRASKLSLAGAAAALILFLWMGWHVLSGEAFSFDLPIRNAVHSIASPALTVCVRGLTALGAPSFLIVVTFLAAWRFTRRNHRVDAIRLTLAGIGSEAFNEALKLIFHRARPEPFFGLHAPDSYSFPSGHAMGSACFYITLALILGRGRILAAVLALAIGLSRVYLGVHYPSDVLAGFAAAAVGLALIHSQKSRNI